MDAPANVHATHLHRRLLDDPVHQLSRGAGRPGRHRPRAAQHSVCRGEYRRRRLGEGAGVQGRL